MVREKFVTACKDFAETRKKFFMIVSGMLLTAACLGGVLYLGYNGYLVPLVFVVASGSSGLFIAATLLLGHSTT